MFTSPADTTTVVNGAGDGCILVYTDDCSGNNPLIEALDALGLAYTHYFQSPYPFEAMVSGDMFNLILVDHSCYHDFSYAWDELVMQYQAGKSIGIASYDWDGSDDVSGAVSSFLALGGASYAHDVPTQGPLHVWNTSPLFTGSPGTLVPTQNFYLDEGDGWTFATAEGGWTSSPQAGEGAAVIGPRLVMLGFLPDQLEQVDKTNLWRNAIEYLRTGGPTPVQPTTWGAIKQRFR